MLKIRLVVSGTRCTHVVAVIFIISDSSISNCCRELQLFIFIVRISGCICVLVVERVKIVIITVVATVDGVNAAVIVLHV